MQLEAFTNICTVATFVRLEVLLYGPKHFTVTRVSGCNIHYMETVVSMVKLRLAYLTCECKVSNDKWIQHAFINCVSI